MKATVEKLENNRVKLLIEVEEGEVSKALDRAYRTVAGQVNIPGFRRGRAPRQIIEARFGKGVLWQEALDDLVPHAYSHAVMDTQIEPITDPEFDLGEFEEGAALVFSAEVEVKPEVILKEYTGLQGVLRLRPITQTEVDTVLEDLRQRQAELVDAGRETVQANDFVTIDFEGFLDGKPFQGGAAKGYQLEIGSGTFVEGFEDQLIGASVDEELEVAVTFPEDMQAPDLAGKDATFKVVVHAIKVKEVPDLDDEFAKDVSEHDDLASLRREIEEELDKQMRENAKRALENDLLDQVVEDATMELTATLLDPQIEATRTQLETNLSRSGMTIDAYLEAMSQTSEDLEADLKERAEQAIRRDLVLDAIAKKEGFRPAREEIQARLTQLFGTDEIDLNDEHMRSHYERMERSIFVQMQSEKVLKFLVENAEVTEEIVDGDAESETDDAAREASEA